MNPRRFKEALNEKGIKSDISKVLLVKWPESVSLCTIYKQPEKSLQQ